MKYKIEVHLYGVYSVVEEETKLAVLLTKNKTTAQEWLLNLNKENRFSKKSRLGPGFKDISKSIST